MDRDRFAASFASFAADTAADQAAFMADSQVPWGVDALNGAAPQPAWRTEPTRHLVVTDDRMIPPPAQRAMAERAGARTVEVPGNHSVHVSRPGPAWSPIRSSRRTRLTGRPRDGGHSSGAPARTAAVRAPR
ncbi:alpha/beta fold hydrolase [Streptomyces sp. NPDC001635]